MRRPAGFSELTFSGGAARNPFMPLMKNEEFAEMIDLGQAGERLDRGRRLAAALGWSEARPAGPAAGRSVRDETPSAGLGARAAG